MNAHEPGVASVDSGSEWKLRQLLGTSSIFDKMPTPRAPLP
jgi:hypothetical protein